MSTAAPAARPGFRPVVTEAGRPGAGPLGADARGDDEGNADQRPGPGRWCSSTSPAIRAIAGSRHIRVPKAAVLSRRSAYISRLNGTTGSSSGQAEARQQQLRGQAPAERPGPATSVATTAATGRETASPCRPASSSPTAWVSRM